jgi:hypothetical protein
MKIENKFISIFSSFIFFIFLTGYLLFLKGTLSSPDWTAFLAGGSLTTLNFILGLISLKIAVRSPDKRFLVIVFGGMMFRMLLMLVFIYISLKILQIKVDVFIFVIFGFYTLYLVAEILYFFLLKENRS